MVFVVVFVVVVVVVLVVVVVVVVVVVFVVVFVVVSNPMHVQTYPIVSLRCLGKSLVLPLHRLLQTLHGCSQRI